jgi:hypothetical protein
VGGVEGDGQRAEPHIVATDGTAVLVGGQQPLAELRVAFLRRGLVYAEGEADCVEDVWVDGLGEVVLQQSEPADDLVELFAGLFVEHHPVILLSGQPSPFSSPGCPRPRSAGGS